MRVAWNRKALIGMVYGRLTVIELDTDKTTNRKLYWRCVCSCGNITSVQASHLLSEHTQSCGCLNKERIAIASKAKKGIKRISDDTRLESMWRTYYRGFISQARCRGIQVDLTIDDVKQISTKNCFYCDKLPELKKQISKLKYGISDFKASGIDRVDTTKHYYLDNCVPCCYNCNREKGYITPKMVKQLYVMLRELGSIK